MLAQYGRVVEFFAPDIAWAEEFETYESFEQVARMRLAIRDLDDWPVLATAFALRSPIWTEGNDFFRNRRRHLDDRPG